MNLRDRLSAALAKPLPDGPQEIHNEAFDPWGDLIQGIDGGYSSESDALMIGALEAVRDRKPFAFIDEKGFVAEFALYVLSGHGMTDYGTSPRGGWPDPQIADLWDPLIEKWKAYAAIAWGNSAPSR